MIAFLPVMDLEKSLAFYRANFDLPVAFERPGKVAILQAAGQAFLGLAHKADRKPGDKTFTFSFVVEDAAAWHRRLEAAGVPLQGPPVYKPDFAINILYATDPDGHTVEVLEMRDAGWPRA